MWVAEDTTIIDVYSVNGFMQMIVCPSRIVKPSYELRYFLPITSRPRTHVVTSLNCLIVLLIFSKRFESSFRSLLELASTKNVDRSNKTSSSHSVSSAIVLSCFWRRWESGTRLWITFDHA